MIRGLRFTDNVIQQNGNIFLTMSFNGTDIVTYSLSLTGEFCDPGEFPVSAHRAAHRGCRRWPPHQVSM